MLRTLFQEDAAATSSRSFSLPNKRKLKGLQYSLTTAGRADGSKGILTVMRGNVIQNDGSPATTDYSQNIAAIQLQQYEGAGATNTADSGQTGFIPCNDAFETGEVLTVAINATLAGTYNYTVFAIWD